MEREISPQYTALKGFIEGAEQGDEGSLKVLKAIIRHAVSDEAKLVPAYAIIELAKTLLRLREEDIDRN